jgi:hypothetical protein
MTPIQKLLIITEVLIPLIKGSCHNSLFFYMLLKTVGISLDTQAMTFLTYRFI